MVKTEKPRFDDLINITSDAFNASAEKHGRIRPQYPQRWLITVHECVSRASVHDSTLIAFRLA